MGQKFRNIAYFCFINCNKFYITVGKQNDYLGIFSQPRNFCGRSFDLFNKGNGGSHFFSLQDGVQKLEMSRYDK